MFEMRLEIAVNLLCEMDAGTGEEGNTSTLWLRWKMQRWLRAWNNSLAVSISICIQNYEKIH